MAAVWLAITAVVCSGWLGDAVTTALTDGVAITAALGGAGVIFHSTRRIPQDRTPWVLLGVAMLLWGIGEVLWGTYEVILREDVPFPSIADVAYLGAVPFAIAGVLAFARGCGARFHVRSFLDGCLVSGSVLFITWALVLGPAWRDDQMSLTAHLINIAYPVTDLVLAVLALVLVHWSNTADRSALRMVAGALLVMVAADIGFTWLTTNEAYSSSNPISMMWPASYLLLAWSTTHRTARPQEAARAEESMGSLLTPYIPLLGAIAVGAPRLLAGNSLGPFLAINGLGLVVLLLARQALTALDLRTSVAALHAREADLERMAMEDPLTGLANRASFAARLEASLGTTHTPPAVVYIDLDGFKQVNDTFGHAMGDALLGDVAARLRACATPSMTVARLGGDEFVVLVVDGEAEAVAIAERILDALAVPFRALGESISFQASLGIGVAQDGGSPDEAVRRADAAMYVAKTTGKGRAVIYPDAALLQEPAQS